MSTQVQYRRGTAAQNNSFVGALAEITVDTTNGTLRVHNGIAAGGSNIATVAYVDNAISSLSANSITDGTSSVTIIATNGNIRANVGGSTIQLLSSAGANVTGYVSATGNVTGGNVTTAGLISATGNISGGNLSGTSIVGTLTTAAQTNITSVGTLTSLAVTGNITSGNLSGTSIVGTLTTAAQTNITSVGTLTALTVTGNVTGGNLNTGAQVVATGNITGGNLRTSAVTIGSTGAVSGVTTLSASGNANVGNLGAATVVATTLTGTVSTAAQTNITSVGTLTALTVTGNVTGGNLITAGLVSLSSITKTGSNGVGNIGSSTSVFDTVFAKATSAQYADVAERYLADADYPTGTVLVFGGDREVTQSQIDHGTAIAGTVSDKPAYVMNNALEGDHVATVALLGRVPVRVIGTIRPGDLLVASELPGIATSLVPDRYRPGCVIGKALGSYDGQREGVIEAVVGRL